MNSRLLSFLVAAIAYGVCLTFAALLLSGFHINFWWGLLAWALFTLSIMIVRPVVRFFVKIFTKKDNASGARHGVALVAGLLTVFLSLALTVHVAPAESVRIDNWWTWVLATLIVWIGSAVYDLVADRLVESAKPIGDKAAAKILGE
jgi:hypothetical protein